MKRNRNSYPDELKLKIVQEYLTTDVGREALQKKYGVSGNGCINNWMRKFGLAKSEQKQISNQAAMSKETGKPSRERELEARIKQLEKDLEYERLRAHALDTMINIAERELKIPIRKKSGTKQ